MAVLIALGEAAIAVDIHVDVWFYAKLGSFEANLLLHGIILGVMFAVCIWKKYGIKWIIPGLLEFGYLIGMSYADTSYVPYLTAFMGLLISWIFMLVASGYKPQESRTSVEKIASQIL